MEGESENKKLKMDEEYQKTKNDRKEESQKEQKDNEDEQKKETPKDEDEDEKMCRYCFGGEEDGDLISPCKCAGGQKWVHLSCLRRWQRMVLVSQPTHPAFYEDDVRHHKCNVCLSEFTCAPPTRHELMASFTGAEIAALIDAGCVIVSEEQFSNELEEQITRSPLLGGSYYHWMRGVYLITEVNEEDPEITIPCEDEDKLEMVKDRIGEELAIKVSGQTLKLAAAGSLEGVPESELGARLETLEIPCVLVLRRVDANCGDDHVSAVNLTRPYDGPLNKRIVDAAMNAVSSKHAAAARVELKHFNGGPCHDKSISTCIVPGGNGKGWTAVKDLKEAIKLAYSRAAKRCPEQQSLGGGQTVEIQGLKARPDLNGEIGLLLRFDKPSGRWLVRLKNGEGKKVKPDNLKGLDGVNGRVFVFWGDAEWSRAQLLGEIARGHWGLCRATVHELVTPPSERWHPTLNGRLAFAPVTEMTESFLQEARREMNVIREEARAVVALQNETEQDEG
eukprot:m.4738 g.4738  ORF g.4738 m.4738 type:complete len:506 (-) comp3080_c0_seq1:147-1664(-)